MGLIAVQLGFEPVNWPRLVMLLAWSLIVIEIVVLVAGICRSNLRQSPARALGLCASILVAPLALIVSLAYGIMTASAGKPMPARQAIRVSMTGTMLLILIGLSLSEPVILTKSIAGIISSVPNLHVVVIATLVVGWVIRSYRRTTSPLKPWARVILLALRVLVILLLAIVAARPRTEYKYTLAVRRTVLVGMDISKSMLRKDMPSDYRNTTIPPDSITIGRLISTKNAILGTMEQFTKLTEIADVKFFTFDSNPSSLWNITSPMAGEALIIAKADGDATALGDSMLSAVEPLGNDGSDLAALVLFTDGCNNTSLEATPAQLADRMNLREVPIHTVGVGWPTVISSTKSLKVKKLTAPEEINAFNRLAITTIIETMGLSGRQVEVTVNLGEDVIATRIIDIDTKQQNQQLDFFYVPRKVGFHRLVVDAKVLGEAVRNLESFPTKSQLVHVVDRELRVLYIEGKLRYEIKYIARALAKARRFNLDRRIIFQPLRANRKPELSEQLDDWLIYHAIIIGDVRADRFSDRQLEIIKTLVGQYGKGLCMIGGGSSFGRGGWDKTPLADVLPIDLDQSKQVITSDIKVTPTRRGLRSDLMAIGDVGDDSSEDIAKLWQSLDELPGANRLGPAKAIAHVLATTQKGLSEPLIVAQPYGKGRSLAIAFDMTWKWALNEKDTAQNQKRFWRQVALYLCAPSGNISITTDSPTYDLQKLLARQQTITVTARVEDSTGRAIVGTGDETITMADPNGKTSQIPLVNAGDFKQGKITVSEAGTYILEYSSEVEGETLSTTQRFVVIHRDLESLDVLADHSRLERMSKQTAGQFVTLAKLDNLFEYLHTSAKEKKIPQTRTANLADDFRWYVVSALIFLLCAEWAVRKRKSLV